MSEGELSDPVRPNPDSGPTGNLESRSLHPATLFVPLIETTLALIPVGIGVSLFAGMQSALYLGGWFVVLPVALLNIARYLSLRYEVQGRELIIRSGLISRRDRRIPLKRIQDTRIRQGPLQQLLRLARVQIRTAGSDEQEAELSVISLHEAELLKSLIVRRQSGDADTAVSGRTVETGPPLLELGWTDLLLGGVTSRLATTLTALVGALIYFELVLRIGSRFLPDFGRFFDPLDRIPIPDPWRDSWFFPFLDFLLADRLLNSALIIFAGLAFASVGFVLRYFGYRLARQGQVLSKTHGLWTKAGSALNQGHVQALRVDESLLRRWLGLRSIRVDSAGDQRREDDRKKVEVFVPVVSRSVSRRIIEEILPALVSADPDWKRVSPRAVRRACRKAWAVLTLLIVVNLSWGGMLVFALVPAYPLAYFVCLQRFRHTGYWYDEEYLLFRKGWFNRSTLFLPIRNLQSVSLTQTYFDRRLGLATLSVDVAGQTNTGGGAAIRNLPFGVARSMQIHLADRAAATRFIP